MRSPEEIDREIAQTENLDAIATQLESLRAHHAWQALVKVLQKTWAKSPHPDLAAAYAYARVGDSTRDRFDRIRQLAALNPHSIESPIAVATAAIEARMYDEARHTLEPLLPERLTQRIATLMARIEAGENGEKGRVREWLARAMNAARDPAWIADGVISDHWEPTSPVDGRLDAFQWRVVLEYGQRASRFLSRRFEFTDKDKIRAVGFWEKAQGEVIGFANRQSQRLWLQPRHNIGSQEHWDLRRFCRLA